VAVGYWLLAFSYWLLAVGGFHQAIINKQDLAISK